MRPALAISLSALPTFLSGLEQSLMATSAAAIALQMGSDTVLAWLLAAFFIASSVATPIYGRLGDHFGPIPVLIVAILIFAAGNVLAALATGPAMLVAARFVQGLGGGALVSLPQAFLGQVMAPRQRAAYQGYIVSIAFLANTFGPPLGGFLIGGLGWQAIFWFEVPLALVAAAALMFAPRHVPHHEAETPRRLSFDWVGALFLMASISSLMMTMQSVSRASTPGASLGWGALFVVTGIGFVLVERVARDPLLPLDLLKRPIVWKSGLIVFLYGFLFTGLSSYLPVLLRDHFRLPPQEVGLLMMPLLGAIGIGSILTGQMVSRTGRTLVFTTVGLTCAATVLTAVAFALQRLSFWETALWMGLVGLFMGTTLGVVQVALLTGTPMSMIGRATAFVQLARTCGASLSGGVGGLIYALSQHVFTDGSGGLDKAVGAGSASAASGISATPFAVLFLFFALTALAAAVTASRCRLARIA